MSHPPEKKTKQRTAVAAPVAPQSPATVETVLGIFAPDALSELIVEGFARAFERKMQGTSLDVLTETLQLAADLRVFKEGLFLNEKQVCTLLQISARTFDRYKAEKLIEVDPHIGPGCTRYSLFSILEARSRLVREAAPAHRA